MKKHLKIVKGTLDIDDPQQRATPKQCLPDHLCSECKPAAGDKTQVKN